MSVYEQLVATGKYIAVEDPPNISLQMSQSNGPRSIKIAEFEYIRNLVLSRNLKRGYEIATGFGVSVLAAGLAFKETGGKIATMDCYIEEKIEDYNAARSDERIVHPDAEGFKSVKYLVEMFGLEDTVFPKVGWSPDDTESAITEVFPDLRQQPLDFVFIDGGHFINAVQRDIESIVPFVAPGSCILLHDVSVGNFGVGFPSMVKKLLGRDYNIVVPYPVGFNMALVEL